MSEAIKELEEWKAALGGHIKTIEDTWGIIHANPQLHAVPEFRAGKDGGATVVIRLINFAAGADKKGGELVIEGAPAMLIYEAYREALSGVFAGAIERAKTSVEAKAKEIQQRLAAEKAAIAEAERSLAAFLPAPPVKAVAKGGRR